MAANTEPRALRDDELLIERVFDAPLALVFRVWSERDHMLGWLGPADFTCTHLDYDFRVGGKWRACIVADAFGESWMGGEFKEIEQNRRIVYTFKWDGDDKDYALQTLITVTFEAAGDRTIQVFHQTPFASVESRDSHMEGWNESFDREQVYIAQVAREESGITVTAFKWVPPFAQGLVRDIRVRWALEEAGLSYTVRLIDQDDQKSAAYRALQPFGQVPVLQDGNLALFESGAIVLHISGKSPALMPEDPGGRARVAQNILMALNSIEPFVQELAIIDLFHPGEAWTAERRPQAEAFLKARLDALADWLGDREYLDGRFTGADIVMTHVLRSLRHTDLLDAYPVLKAYKERNEARPAFQRALDGQLSAFRATEAARSAA